MQFFPFDPMMPMASPMMMAPQIGPGVMMSALTGPIPQVQAQVMRQAQQYQLQLQQQLQQYQQQQQQQLQQQYQQQMFQGFGDIGRPLL